MSSELLWTLPISLGLFTGILVWAILCAKERKK